MADAAAVLTSPQQEVVQEEALGADEADLEEFEPDTEDMSEIFSDLANRVYKTVVLVTDHVLQMRYTGIIWSKSKKDVFILIWSVGECDSEDKKSYLKGARFTIHFHDSVELPGAVWVQNEEFAILSVQKNHNACKAIRFVNPTENSRTLTLVTKDFDGKNPSLLFQNNFHHMVGFIPQASSICARSSSPVDIIQHSGDNFLNVIHHGYTLPACPVFDKSGLCLGIIMDDCRSTRYNDGRGHKICWKGGRVVDSVNKMIARKIKKRKM